jgi:hypothetical protein
MTRKNFLFLIGIIQILSLIDIFPFYYRLINNIDFHTSGFLLSDIWQIVLLLIIISSIPLYFRQSRYALRIYYPEFILRLYFFIMTFGFILWLNLIFKNLSFYNVLAIIVIILEILRLILSIFYDIKWNKCLHNA